MYISFHHFLKISFTLCLLFVSSSCCASIFTQNNSGARELYLQLTELACADIDNRFAFELKALQQAAKQDHNAYQMELMKSFFLIKKFRQVYETSSWEDKQNNIYLLPQIYVTTQEQKYFHQLIKNQKKFLSETIALRPNTPNYLLYRQEILKNIASISTHNNSYRYRILQPKQTAKEINILKQKLKQLGYLDYNCPENNYYDTELLYAVKKFQSDHMIVTDGIVGYQTYSLIFQSPSARALSLARAILRLGDTKLLNSNTYILVNIPDTEMYVYQNGSSIFNSKVIVGTYKRPTPRLASAINQVVLNPTWTVPPSIREDYLRHLKKDPLYLEKNGIKIVDYQNKVIDPRFMDFSHYINEKKFPYKMVQSPGTHNALGLYKFLFPNSQFIYLHSTSNPKYFTKATRTLSSGCVRVQKSPQLAEFLLKGTAYHKQKIQTTINSGKTTYIKTVKNIPVFLAYWTAYISEAGQVFYRPDPYDLDKGFVLPSAVRLVR